MNAADEAALEAILKEAGTGPADSLMHRTAPVYHSDGREITESNYVPEFMQPWTPTPFELPEITSMRLELDEPLMGGRHVIVSFPNGYGVSIVNHWGAYGGLEIGWLNQSGDLWDPFDTGDTVLGHLDQIELIKELDRVAKLPPA